MAQENQGTITPTPESLPVKRKRGRPRKDGSQSQPRVQKVAATPTPDTVQRSQRRRTDTPVAITGDPLVGQHVTGVLDGSFEAGYLLTVRVGDTGTLLRGLVFRQGLSVPISGGNDLAPHLNMVRRVDVPLPPGGTPALVHGSASQSAQKNERPVERPKQNLNQVSEPVSETPKRAPQASPPQLQINQMASKGVENNSQQVPQDVINQVDSTGVQNNTQQVPEVVVNTFQGAEGKTKVAGNLLSEGHSDDVNQVSQVSSQAKDSGNEKGQPNKEPPFFTPLQATPPPASGSQDDKAPSTEISLNHARQDDNPVVGPKPQLDHGFAATAPQTPKVVAAKAIATGMVTESVKTLQDGASQRDGLSKEGTDQQGKVLHRDGTSPTPFNSEAMLGSREPQTLNSTLPKDAAQVSDASKSENADSVGGLQMGLN